MASEKSSAKAKASAKSKTEAGKKSAARATAAEAEPEGVSEENLDHDAMTEEEIERATDQILGANPVIGLSREEIIDAVNRLFGIFAANPKAVISEELALTKELMRVLAGDSQITPDRKDRRFAHAIWQDNPFYKRVMQSYLAWRKSLYEILDSTNASADDKERARFALSLFTEAVAPTNTIVGNPGSVMRIMQTRGKSLLKGAKNMLDDLLNNGGMPKQVDEEAFSVGKNIAVTPGAVVYRDDVFELIQYKPATSEVYSRPLLIVPPQINKFYIVDLAPNKSFAEYATNNGVQLFIISWRNPTSAQRDWNLETYLTACKKAAQVVCSICKSDDINLMAACAGGYTAATLLGHLAAKEDKIVNSLTLLVTVLDSSAPSLMGMFSSDATIASAIKRSRKHGVLEGKEMARVFAWLRPNDLVWSFFANNYVMGNAPPAFDILYWNADTTRLPAEFHADMLSLYMHNPLVTPNKLKALDTGIDMSKVNCDSYIVAGITDHITPWKACYETRKVIGGDKQFILSSSGHIQAIVNPPNNKRAKFYTNSDLSLDADEWLKTAKLQQGSWWDHWRTWIGKQAGAKKPAPKQLGNKQYPAGDQAPGRYVHQR